MNKTLRSRAAAFLLAACAFASTTSAQTFSLSNVWNVATGAANLTGGTDGGNRAIAWSSVSNQVFVADRGAAANTTFPIDVFDGTTGALVGDTNGVNGSAPLKCDQIGVGDDGVLYGVPLDVTVSNTSPLIVYSWSNWNNAPFTAYNSGLNDIVITQLSGKRIGDSMATTGAGTNTQILLGAGGGNAFVLLSTVDGGTFTPTILTNTTLTGLGNVYGLSFYTNNTFIVRSSSTLYLVQFPANFASLPSPVATTILGSAPLGNGGTSALSYSAAGSLLGVVTNNAATNSAALIYSMTNFPTSATFLASANYFSSSTTATDGNGTVGVALGGTGKTNWLYALTSNAGLHAYRISVVFGAVAPLITSQPASVTGAFPPQSLSVTVSGTTPIFYQWYQNSTNGLAGATPVSGATNATLTFASAVTNFYYVIATNAAASANSVTSSVVQVSLISATTNSVVSQILNLPPGTASFPFLANDDNSRGMAYDAVTGNLIVANKSGGAHLYLIDGTTGTNVGAMNTSGIYTGGTFPIDQVGVADDGAVYAGNLALTGSGGMFSLSRWDAATTNSTPSTAFFAGDPGNGSGDRWGDSMAVRGSGVNTQILLGSWGQGAGPGTNVVLFTTTDGQNFNPTLIGVPGVPAAFSARGLAFGAGNTFYAKNYLGDLYVVSFDPTGVTNAAVILDYSAANSSQIPSHLVGLGIDASNNILGGINLSDHNPDLQLFQLTGNANPPVLFDQSFFSTFNSGANGNELGIVAVKYPRIYAMDVDFGIIGVTYGVPASTPPVITAQPSGGTVFASGVPFTLSVGVSGTLPLNFQWQKNSVSNAATAVNISGANGATFTLNPPTTNDTAWYDVVVTNFGGKATSAPVLLTIIAPAASPAVTNLWKQAAGSQPYLDSSSYASRGLAYDSNSATVLIANRVATTITILNAADGSLSPLGINTAGLPMGTFALDQIAVSDDGVLYAGNLVIPGDTFSFGLTRWEHVSDGTGASESAAYLGDPGNGSGDRWGDTMAIRGSGVNTQILLGSQNGTNVSLLTTTDGSTFTALPIPVSGPPGGFAGTGVAFGAGNTFWAVGGFGFDLRQIAFDPTGATPATVLQDYSAGVETPNDFAGLAVDAANNILAGVSFNDTPDDLLFYQLTGATNAPVLFDQDFFASENINSQENAVSVLKFPYAFSLDVNNGLVAALYSVPPPVAAPIKLTITSSPTSLTITWPTTINHSYSLQSTTSLLPSGTSWTTLPGYPVSASGSTLSKTITPLTGPGTFYRVVGN